MKKISIIIPVYNEFKTLDTILQKISETNFCNLEKEIIIVDDCSTDGTKELYSKYPEYKILFHEKNLGKGAGIRTGLGAVTGDIVIIQDADLEYNPADYVPLVQTIIEGADVCYGSRIKNFKNLKYFLPLSLLGNIIVTTFTNLIYGSKLTDMETCYKTFKTDIIKNIEIKSDKFDFEPEITAKILKQKIKIKEIPITYNGRNFSQGKKITWKDGIQALITLVKYRFID